MSTISLSETKLPQLFLRRGSLPNPLMVPNVLHCIFSFMSHNELLLLRFVCKRWNEKSTHYLQSKSIASLKEWEDLDSFTNTFFSKEKENDGFMKSLKLSQSFPSEKGSLALNDRIGKIGPSIENLVISCNLNAEEWVVALFYIFTNLKDLKIEGAIPYDVLFKKERSSPFRNHLLSIKSITFQITNKRSEQLYIRNFSKDIFSVMPNLMKISWESGESNNSSSINRNNKILAKAMFHCLLGTQTVTKITKFCLPNLTLGLKDLSQLARAAYPLERLEISLGADVNSGILGEILCGYGQTLKVLYLGFESTNSVMIRLSEETELVKLDTLYLEDYNRSIGFVGNLKKLRKLVLLNCNFERAFCFKWEEGQPTLGLIPQLEIFEVYSDPYRYMKKSRVPMAIVVRLSHYFPKLRILRVPNLNDKCLKRVLKSFKHLEELRAPLGSYTNEAFKAVLSPLAILEEGAARTRYSNFLCYDYHLENVSNLKRLEVDSTFLTDNFITQGIINWKGLRHLGIKGCKIDYSTLTRLLMELDLHCLKSEGCEITSNINDHPIPLVEKNNNDNKEVLTQTPSILMTYGDIKMWRRLVKNSLLQI